MDTGYGRRQPNAHGEQIRNVAYACFRREAGCLMVKMHGANKHVSWKQRNLKLALVRPRVLKVAEAVVAETKPGSGIFRADIVKTGRTIKFTTKIFRARGRHLDDRHTAMAVG